MRRSCSVTGSLRAMASDTSSRLKTIAEVLNFSEPEVEKTVGKDVIDRLKSDQ